jgi:hypothetical protein
MTIKEGYMGNTTDNLSPLQNPETEPPASLYELRVKGCMDEIFWSDWFGSFDYEIDLEKQETRLRGLIRDQAELYGLLSLLRNRGLTLISVQQMYQDAE